MIIGLGAIGYAYDKNQKIKDTRIFSHAKAITSHKKFKLIGAIDILKNKRIDFKKKYSVPVFSNIKDAFNDFRPEIVIIATPTNSHFKIFLEIIKIYRPLLIICEKPMTSNLVDAKKMLEISKKNKIKLFTNYFRVSDPTSLKIKKIVKNYKGKESIKVNAWYSKGLINNGSHLINLFQFFFGKVISVEILGYNKVKKNILEPDVKIEFKKSEVILRAAWEKKFSILDFDMLSSEFRIIYEKFGDTITFKEITKDKNFHKYRTLKNKKIIKNNLNTYQKKFYDEVYKNCKNLSCNLCSGQDSVETYRVLNAIIDKIK